MDAIIRLMQKKAGTKCLVIAVDIDGVLCSGEMWDCHEEPKPLKENIEKVNRLYAQHFVVLYTARRIELAESTLNWLLKHGVRYHAIRFEKMPFDLLLDDKCWNPVYQGLPSQDEPYP